MAPAAASATIQGVLLRGRSLDPPQRIIISGFQHSRRFYNVRTMAAQDEQEDDSSAAAGDRIDWDKAWLSYTTFAKKQKQQQNPLLLFLEKINMNQYVTKNPVHRSYAEVDEFRKIEESNLKIWTDPKFTFTGFSVIFVLFVYMVVTGPPA